MGAGAYLCWGLFPLYWPLLDPAGSLEALAHRIIWSLVFVGLLLTFTHRLGRLPRHLVDRRRVGFLGLASVVIAVNWGAFIYGVTHDKVIETSLGYFINPLVTVLLGVFVLQETLRRPQWVASPSAPSPSSSSPSTTDGCPRSPSRSRSRSPPTAS